MSGFDQPGFQAWLKTRPHCVQDLAREFPPMTRVLVDGVMLRVFGYTEDDMLIVSRVNPVEDYDGAMEAKELLCAKHLRDAVEAGK